MFESVRGDRRKPSARAGRREIGAICALGLFGVLLLSSGPARAEPPSVRVESADLVSPAQADTYYGTATTHTNGMCALSADFCNAPQPDEIRELARSLSRDKSLPTDQFAQNVYDYVRLNIDTEFRYGLSKGGYTALLDQTGTPFDQAELMVLLLKEGGVATAGYQSGTIELNAAQFQAWTGLTDAVAACRLLADGGIPAQINNSTSSSCTYTGSVTKVVLKHIWVTANGKVYDPAYKTHILKTGIDLAAVLQCGTAVAPTCGASAVAVALPAGTTGYDAAAQANYAQGVKEPELSTALNTAAIKLQTYIQTNMPLAQVEDVVGGRVIDLNAGVTASTALAYPVVAGPAWTQIPDQYRSKFGFQFDNFNVVFFGDETSHLLLGVGGMKSGPFPATRTTSLTTSRAFRIAADPPLSTPSSVLATSVRTGVTTDIAPLTISVLHPYAAGGGAYMDEVISKQIEVGGQFGPNGPPNNTAPSQIFPFQLIQIWGAAGVRPAKISTSVQYTLPTRWIAQSSRALKINDAIGGVRTTQHHTAGIQAWIYDTGTILDASTALSISSANSDISRKATAAQSATGLLAAIEGSVFEQVNDVSQSDSSVSLFYFSNQKGTRFYDINAANLEAALNQTSNYGSLAGQQEKDFVRSYFSVGQPAYSGILPKNGDTGYFSDTSGGGINIVIAPLAFFSSDSTRFSYTTTYRNKGSGGVVSSDPTLVTQIPRDDPKPFSENIDLESGFGKISFAPDIEIGVGGLPSKLSYARTLRLSGEGGSSVNLTATARFSNEAFEAMGADSALDASAFITSNFYLNDLGKLSSFQNRLTSIFVSSWITRQFSGNVVEIDKSDENLQFNRLPDGSFNSPNGASYRLTQTENRTSFIGPKGFNFKYYKVGFSLLDVAGSKMTFAWDTCGDGTVTMYQFGRNCYSMTKWNFPDDSWISYDYRYECEFQDFGCNYPHSLASFPGPLLWTISSSSGRSFSLRYPASGIIINGPGNPVVSNLQITDDSGRVVEYSLALEYGISPNGVSTRTKVFIPGGALLYQEFQETNANWKPIRKTFYTGGPDPKLVVSFDSLGRVKSVADGAGNLTTYYPGKVANERAVVGVAVDALGGVSQEYFQDSNKVRTIDPLLRVTTSTYDNWRRLTRTVSPEGDAEERTYDVRSNVLSVRRKAKPGSGLADTVTSTIYFGAADVRFCDKYKVCNKPTSETDAGAFVTNYEWDEDYGQLKWVEQPVDSFGLRPRTDFAYDLFGPTGQQQRLMTSKTEKVSATETVVTAYSYDLTNGLRLQSSTVDPGGLNLRTCYQYDAIGNVVGVTDARAATCPTGAVQ